MARQEYRQHREAGHAYAESVAEAVLNLCDCRFDGDPFDTRLEFAVRSWALQSPHVLTDVQAADHVRLEALVAMFARFGLSRESAESRARASYLVRIGFISMQATEDILEGARIHLALRPMAAVGWQILVSG